MTTPVWNSFQKNAESDSFGISLNNTAFDVSFMERTEDRAVTHDTGARANDVVTEANNTCDVSFMGGGNDVTVVSAVCGEGQGPNEPTVDVFEIAGVIAAHPDYSLSITDGHAGHVSAVNTRSPEERGTAGVTMGDASPSQPHYGRAQQYGSTATSISADQYSSDPFDVTFMEQESHDVVYPLHEGGRTNATAHRRFGNSLDHNEHSDATARGNDGFTRGDDLFHHSYLGGGGGGFVWAGNEGGQRDNEGTVDVFGIAGVVAGLPDGSESIVPMHAAHLSADNRSPEESGTAGVTMGDASPSQPHGGRAQQYGSTATSISADQYDRFTEGNDLFDHSYLGGGASATVVSAGSEGDRDYNEGTVDVFEIAREIASFQDDGSDSIVTVHTTDIPVDNPVRPNESGGGGMATGDVIGHESSSQAHGRHEIGFGATATTISDDGASAVKHMQTFDPSVARGSSDEPWTDTPIPEVEEPSATPTPQVEEPSTTPTPHVEEPSAGDQTDQSDLASNAVECTASRTSDEKTRNNLSGHRGTSSRDCENRTEDYGRQPEAAIDEEMVPLEPPPRIGMFGNEVGLLVSLCREDEKCPAEFLVADGKTPRCMAMCCGNEVSPIGHCACCGRIFCSTCLVFAIQDSNRNSSAPRYMCCDCMSRIHDNMDDTLDKESLRTVYLEPCFKQQVDRALNAQETVVRFDMAMQVQKLSSEIDVLYKNLGLQQPGGDKSLLPATTSLIRVFEDYHSRSAAKWCCIFPTQAYRRDKKLIRSMTQSLVRVHASSQAADAETVRSTTIFSLIDDVQKLKGRTTAFDTLCAIATTELNEFPSKREETPEDVHLGVHVEPSREYLDSCLIVHQRELPSGLIYPTQSMGDRLQTLTDVLEMQKSDLEHRFHGKLRQLRMKRRRLIDVKEEVAQLRNALEEQDKRRRTHGPRSSEPPAAEVF